MHLSRLLGLSMAFGNLILAGCSDPVPPPAQGAFTATFGNSPDVVCPAINPSPVIGVGMISEKEKAMVIDGENGAAVSCKVVPSGSTFVVQNASISQGSTSITLNVVVGSDAEAEGKVSLKGPNTDKGAYVPVNGSTCTFSLIEGGEGRIWLKFDCPTMERAGQIGAACSVQNGIAAFESCETN